MPLESLDDGPDDDSNISTLSIDVPVHRHIPKFDPQRDLMKDDWEKIHLELYKQIEWNMEEAIRYAFAMAILDTERFRDDLECALTFWRQRIPPPLPYPHFWPECFTPAICKLLNDQYYHFLQDSYHLDYVREATRRSPTSCPITYIHAIEALPCLYIALPLVKRTKIDGWDYLMQELEEHRRLGEWLPFLRLAAPLKLLYPKEAEEQITLNIEEWRNIRTVLDAYRSAHGYDAFGLMASYMKVLAAQEAKITRKGVELIMDTPVIFANPLPPFPLLRSF